MAVMNDSKSSADLMRLIVRGDFSPEGIAAARNPSVAMPRQEAPIVQQTRAPARQAPQARQQQRQASSSPFGGLGSLFMPERAQRNRTVELLQQQGVDPTTATLLAADKRALQSYLLDRSQGRRPEYSFMNIDGTLIRTDNFGNVTPMGQFGTGESDTYTERAAAAQRFGLKPGTEDFQRYVLSGDLPSNRDQDPTFGREKDLRTEYEGNPTVKNYAIVRDNYERIRAGVQLGTGAGDIAVIFGYMKMLDPTSVVRENEQATAENAAGVPEKVRNIYNRLLEGDKLPEMLRRQYVEAAGKIYQESASNVTDLNTRYGGLAEAWEIDPSRVFREPETYEPLFQAPAAPGGLPLPPQQNAPISEEEYLRRQYRGETGDGVVDWRDWIAPGRSR